MAVQHAVDGLDRLLKQRALYEQSIMKRAKHMAKRHLKLSRQPPFYEQSRRRGLQI